MPQDGSKQGINIESVVIERARRKRDLTKAGGSLAGEIKEEETMKFEEDLNADLLSGKSFEMLSNLRIADSRRKSKSKVNRQQVRQHYLKVCTLLKVPPEGLVELQQDRIQ